MTSIVTNSAAVSALAVLRDTQSQASNVQNQMATGFRVASASDNAAYWSIATTMRSDTKSIAAARDAISVSIDILDTALATSDLVLDNLDAIMNTFMTARDDQSGYGWSGMENDIIQRVAAIQGAITGANFNGINLLYHRTGDPATLSLVTGVARNVDGPRVLSNTLTLSNYSLIDDAILGGIISSSGIDTVTSKVRRLFPDFGNPPSFIVSLYHRTALNQNLGTADVPEIDSTIRLLAGWAEAARNVYAQLGAIRKSADAQMEQVTRQQEINTKGIGRLVDADMNEVSAKSKALSVREQLGLQSLQLANADAQNILSLFRN